MLSLIIGLFFDVVSLLLFCVVLFLLIIDNSFLQDLSDYTLYLEKNTHFCFLALLLEKVTDLNENFGQNS